MMRDEFKTVKKGDTLITGKNHYIVVDDIIGSNIVYFEDGYYHEVLPDECDLMNKEENNCNTIEIPIDFKLHFDKMKHQEEIDEMIIDRFHSLPKYKQENIVNYVIELSSIDKDGKVEKKYNRLMDLLYGYAMKYGKEIVQESNRFDNELSILDDGYIVGNVFEQVEVYKNYRDVTPHYITEKSYKVYNPNNELIVETNNILTFNDIQLQIKRKNLCGYYVIDTDGTKLNIDKNGRVVGGNVNLFPIFDKQLKELCGF